MFAIDYFLKITKHKEKLSEKLTSQRNTAGKKRSFCSCSFASAREHIANPKMFRILWIVFPSFLTLKYPDEDRATSSDLLEHKFLVRPKPLTSSIMKMNEMVLSLVQDNNVLVHLCSVIACARKKGAAMLRDVWLVCSQ